MTFPPSPPAPEVLFEDDRAGKYPSEFLVYKPDDLAVMFSTPKSQIYKLRREQDWPHHMLSTAIRFSAKDIETILEISRQAQAEPLARVRRTRRTRLGSSGY